ncbi:MAG: FAD-dependent oxidoreductase, partial [Planctomycetota bacterium]
VARLTRIYFDRKYFPYPLEIGQTLAGIGLRRAARAGLSCVHARLAPRRPEVSFEDWVVNRFGHELYRMFFKTYTEKVWGIPCAEINKDWAAQRIRGLSLGAIVRLALLRGKDRPRSLVDRFLYPRRGAGELWQSVADQVRALGGEVVLGSAAVRLEHEGGKLHTVVTADGARHHGSQFYVTMTLADFVAALAPPPPREILAAGGALRHRDFISVMLIIPRAKLFRDQWIYIHDPGVRVARITNYANWSDAMSPDAARTAITMEYFCNRDEPLWCASDAEILALAAAEIERLGLASLRGQHDGHVLRLKNAYPVYDAHYQQNRDLLKHWIGASLANVAPAGRKGLHNYNSQDHAMMSAMFAVRNALEGTRLDVWSVNTEQEYAEEGSVAQVIEERLVPRGVTS